MDANKIWEKISYYIGLLPIGALMGVAVYASGIEIKDFDLWLHLATGRFIVDNGFVPSVDVLSNAIAGKPWVNHEWLFQVLVYQIYGTFGPDGLIKMQVGIVFLTMSILFMLGWSKEKYLIATFGLILMFMNYQQRFTIRPDIFSLLFFAMYIYALALHINKRWIAVFLVVIQVLWSNMHGFFFFGPLFVLIGLVSEWMKRNIPLPWQWNESGRLTDDEYVRLKFIFAGVLLACLVNPQFIKGALYPLGVFFSIGNEGKIFFDYIQELAKPIERHNIFEINAYVFYKIMIVVSAFSFVFNRRRIDISALFFWLIFLVFSLKAVRNAAFFGFAGYLVLITNAMNVSYKDFLPIRFIDKKFECITSIFLSLIMLAWLFQYGKTISTRSYYDFDAYKYKSEFGGVGQRVYPDKAVDFLVDNNIKGNFFNDFNSGAYLLGRTHPNIKVFIDGRTEVYGAEFFKEYQKMWMQGDAVLLDKVINDINLTGALLNSSLTPVPEETLRYFYKKDEWKLVYFDYDGLVFLKDIPANQDFINQYEIDLDNWSPKDLDLYKFGVTRAIPYQFYARAYSLYNIGKLDLALEQAKRAIDINPQYAEPYHIVGQIYIQRKDYQKAFENFRKASMLDPLDKKIRYNLAHSYIDLEQYDGAIEQYLAILEGWPFEIEARFRLTQAYAHKKDAENAFLYLNQILKAKPTALGDAVLVGDIFYEKNMYEETIQVFERIAALDDKSPVAFKKIAVAADALGDKQRASQALQKALEISPDDEELKALKAKLEGPDKSG